MYTIKEAAARSGVSIPTLRAWERRYGVVRPVRTDAGYRLYDEGAIDRLRVMRELLGDGWSAREAARHVLEAAEPLVPREPSPARAAASSAADASASPSGHLERDLVAAATRLDAAGLDALLDEAFASVAFEQAMQSVIFPALAAIGRAWERGELDVAAEHAASNAVVRRLARLFDAAGRSEPRVRAVLGLPSGAHHEIGLLAFAVAARRAGVPVLYLGASVPTESWAAVLDRSGADLVVLGVPTASDVASAEEVVEALQSRARPPTLFVGGAAAPLLPTAAGATALPLDIGAAADVLAAAIRSGARRPRTKRGEPRS
jgi:DNA-binding transcriptional MerR regulator/methylmalonyl-CoA mutase cobalamin-binding subunit